jgi:DNA-binding IclR family transcriptional regulator
MKETRQTRAAAPAKEAVPAADEPTVAAVERALVILQCFNADEPALTLTDISRKTGLYKSTALRLLGTLKRHAFVRRAPDGTYQPGPSVLRLAALYQNRALAREVIEPVLRQLTADTGESSSFNVREDEVRVCAYRVDSPRNIRDHLRVGDVRPLLRGAAGKVLCTFQEIPFDRAQEAAIRESYYCVAHREIEDDGAGIAVPVFGPGQRCEGALVLSGPASRFDAPRVLFMARQLLVAAGGLSDAIGGHGAPLVAAAEKLKQG